MAKGLRSSRNKGNKSMLRSIVFGPAERARKERLSAKLIELTLEPQQKNKEGMKVTDGEEVTMEEIPDEVEAHVQAGEEDMDVDRAKYFGSTAGLVSRSTRRVQKRGHGKARAAMVFPIHIKGKRKGTRLSAWERKKSLKP